jgi:hypothetical protein
VIAKIEGEHSMSLGIQVDKVLAVLLADGWHDVRDNSFKIDAYEFQEGKDVRFGGGTVSAVTGTGARWKEADNKHVYCPFTSILAVKC